jgi:tetratricopeptide (TPR) repeat protein
MSLLFDRLHDSLQQLGPEAACNLLIQHCLESKDYPLLFETRLVQARQRFAISTPEYQDAMREAAAETGNLYIKDGNPIRAWPYFRAIGRPEPVRQAIAAQQPGEDLDAIIEIAYSESLDPLYGFRLILEHHGICRAITCFSQYPDQATRAEAASILAARLHSELQENLRRAIEQAEGAPPSETNIPTLIANRDWLFGEFSYYIDTSHLLSVLQIAADIDNEITLRQALDLAHYGQHLSTAFQHHGDPPFEDPYISYALLYRGLLREAEAEAIAYFTDQARIAHEAQAGSGPAQILVHLLVRLKRYEEAIEAYIAYLSESDPRFLSCPNPMQICEMAGDFESLAQLARREGDPARYLAALIRQSGKG